VLVSFLNFDILGVIDFGRMPCDFMIVCLIFID